MTTEDLMIDESKLPALVGSEKQIAWATEIRTKRIQFWHDDVRRGLIEDTQEDYPKTWETRLQKAVQRFYEADSASWWIDTKGSSDLVKTMGS